MSFTKIITDYQNPGSIGFRLRAKRIKPVLAMMNDIHEKKGCVNILDVGGTEQYWKIVPQGFFEKKNVCVTLLNIPSKGLSEDKERFKYLVGDACNLSDMDDNSFDIVHSNSVIEHVGDWGRMLLFASETKRLARNYYVQTPNFWFPVEPHCMTLFFHWLPKPVRVSLVMRFSLGNWSRQRSVTNAVRSVESARLLDKKMFSSLFEDADITTERFILLPKSLVAIRRER